MSMAAAVGVVTTDKGVVTNDENAASVDRESGVDVVTKQFANYLKR